MDYIIVRSFFASGTPYLRIFTPILTHLIDFLTHQVRIFFTSRCQIHAPAFPSKTSFQHFITSATGDISRRQSRLYLGGSKPPPYTHNVRASVHITPCTARNITRNNVVHITYASAYISRMRSIPYLDGRAVHITAGASPRPTQP